MHLSPRACYAILWFSWVYWRPIPVLRLCTHQTVLPVLFIYPLIPYIPRVSMRMSFDLVQELLLIIMLTLPMLPCRIDLAMFHVEVRGEVLSRRFWLYVSGDSFSRGHPLAQWSWFISFFNYDKISWKRRGACAGIFSYFLMFSPKESRTCLTIVVKRAVFLQN